MQEGGKYVSGAEKKTNPCDWSLCTVTSRGKWWFAFDVTPYSIISDEFEGRRQISNQYKRKDLG